MARRRHWHKHPCKGEEKESCVLVVGAEGAGTCLASRIVSSFLGVKGWNGHGFNCCNKSFCEGERSNHQPCKKMSAGKLVRHVSLPFGANRWLNIGDTSKRYNASFVICTRDIGMSEMSRLRRFRKDPDLIRKQSERARRIISNIIKSDLPYYFWSYESLVFLGDIYGKGLCDFLDVEFPGNIRELIKDGNGKYLISASQIERKSPK